MTPAASSTSCGVHEQPLDFDLELATARSNENPVYYIQYAHARGASVYEAARRARTVASIARWACAASSV